jgi:hypothetical protein
VGAATSAVPRSKAATAAVALSAFRFMTFSFFHSLHRELEQVEHPLVAE